MSETKEKPVDQLILDSGAVIANVNLHHLANHYFAPPDVLAELKSAKTIKMFESLPFEVAIKSPSTESLKAEYTQRLVIEAAKKSGDFPSLSVTDLKVIALTYDIHNQSSSSAEANEVDQAMVEEALKEREASSTDAPSDSETTSTRCLPEGFCEDDDSDDDNGWITEENLTDAIKKMGAFEVAEGLKVACLTTDFAVQNVLLHMNLGLVSLSGYRIKKLKSFVLRCRACFKTTAVMTKEFCPQCGNKMLHKCAVSVDENGEQVLHINYQRLENKRGLKHSIPAPKGGKHSHNEKLFEDQRMPMNVMAKMRLDPLEDGPFSMHDTNSRSAVLGIRSFNNRQRGTRNPNESKGNRRKK